jgi:2-oxo-4-hydroxy-4-carboxy-5-ureidoimidazoline decarboxylase
MKINELPKDQLQAALTQCCGSAAWVQKMMGIFPVKDEESLLAAATVYWHQCTEKDWREAFDHHPKIGGKTKDKWAAEEQSSVANTTNNILRDLETGNQRYLQQFGYIFIVCATGKSAEEMLQLLNQRLNNSPEAEIKFAMEEQDKITRLRLQKLKSTD